MLVHVCGPETELTDMSVDLTFSNSSAVIPQHILRLSLKNNKKKRLDFEVYAFITTLSEKL